MPIWTISVAPGAAGHNICQIASFSAGESFWSNVAEKWNVRGARIEICVKCQKWLRSVAIRLDASHMLATTVFITIPVDENLIEKPLSQRKTLQWNAWKWNINIKMSNWPMPPTKLVWNRGERIIRYSNIIRILVFVFGWFSQTEYYSYSYSGNFFKSGGDPV